MRRAFLAVLSILMTSLGTVFAQDIPVQSGIKNFGSYSNSFLDHIDLATGSIYADFPLVNFKQVGALPPLSFHAHITSPAYSLQQVCDFGRSMCFMFYDVPENTEEPPANYSTGIHLNTSVEGVAITPSSSTWYSAAYVEQPSDGTCSRLYSVCNPIAGAPTTIPDDGECDYPAVCLFFQDTLNTYSLTDPTGHVHKMYRELADYTRYRAADGSGYEISNPGDTDPHFPKV